MLEASAAKPEAWVSRQKKESAVGAAQRTVGIATRRPGSLAERPRVMGALGLGGTGAHALAVRLSAIL
jgi:hypothetical protein